MERQKLDLPINSPQQLEILYDNPITGINNYGEFYCYSFRDNKGSEYSFFAPDKIHRVLKDLVKGSKIKLVKTAVEKNKKLIQDYEVEVLSNGQVNSSEPKADPDSQEGIANDKKELSHQELMRQCFAEATEIQKDYNSVNLNQIAITLYISKTKLNGYGGQI